VEHRLVRRLGLFLLLVPPVFPGWNAVGRSGVVWARCWVLRERATQVERFVSAGTPEGVLSYVWDWPRGHTASGAPSGVGGCWWFVLWVGSARSLRTVQWTRASLFLVFL
jgi:hypothetical protein